MVYGSTAEEGFALYHEDPQCNYEPIFNHFPEMLLNQKDIVIEYIIHKGLLNDF